MDIRHDTHASNPVPRKGRLSLALGALLLLAATAFPAAAQAQDVYVDISTGASSESDAQAAQLADSLQPGEFSWMPERASAGQVVIVVSLPEQRAHVYRNGVRIGVSTVSTGTPDHPTPTGTFEILQKKVMNHSNLYNNAPMPFMQRLTWDGIALHAGKIPGYPASHGCIRLPLAFAKKLYAETQRGMLVVIADDSTHEFDVVYPGDQSPVDTYTGQALQQSGQASESMAIATP